MLLAGIPCYVRAETRLAAGSREGIRSVRDGVVLNGDGELLAGLDVGALQLIQPSDVGDDVAGVCRRGDLLRELPQGLTRLDGDVVEPRSAGVVAGSRYASVEGDEECADHERNG